MEQFKNSGEEYSIHIKHTDRPARQYDDVEIKSVKNFDPKNYDYVYQTYGFKYGIQQAQIDRAIKENKNHFIICNDISTIKYLKRDYGDLVKAVFTYFDAPNDVLRQIQRERNISDDEIELRLVKTSVLYRQFAKEWRLFDGTLANHYNEEFSALRKRMENMLAVFSDSVDPMSVSKHLESTASTLSKKLDDNDKKDMPDYAFIIKPIMDDDFSNIDNYKAIKRYCDNHGIKAEYVDDIQHTGQITEKKQGCIRLSEFVIADITLGHPNVYYEIGYAHACNKPLILLAKYGKKMNFDLQGMSIHLYKDANDLESILKGAIKNVRKHA